MLLFGATPEISHSFRLQGNSVVGYNEKGGEIVRVPLREPIFMRPIFDEKLQTYRSNTT
ncbi:hypothetical protein CCP3SC15_3790001 [Gammaproteobacteria bacterium]